MGERKVHLFGQLVDDCRQQGIPGSKIVVDQALGDAGLLRDVGHGRAGGPLGFEKRPGDVDDFLAPDGRFLADAHALLPFPGQRLHFASQRPYFACQRFLFTGQCPHSIDFSDSTMSMRISR